MKFNASSMMLPAASKTGLGEDACFHTETALGVADGVGAWIFQGVDSGEYSRKLMDGAKKRSTRKADEMLQFAFDRMGRMKGSCTACLVNLKDDKLTVANLGDSGLMVIRESKMILRTRAQVHGVNAPFQLGNDDEGKPQDLPRDAEMYSIDVKYGDIVVLATDGVFDNLFDQTIIDMLVEMPLHSPWHATPRLFASAIAARAFKTSMGRDYATPFGSPKPDDITCVVGTVVE